MVRTACIRYTGKGEGNWHWIPHNSEFSFGWGAPHPDGKPHHQYFHVGMAGSGARPECAMWYFPDASEDPQTYLGLALANSLIEYGHAHRCDDLGYILSAGKPVEDTRISVAEGDGLFLPFTYNRNDTPPFSCYWNLANPIVRSWMAERMAYIAQRTGGRLFLDGATPLRMDLLQKNFMPGGTPRERMHTWMDYIELILDRVGRIAGHPLRVIANSNIHYPASDFRGGTELQMQLFCRWARNPHVVGLMWENAWAGPEMIGKHPDVYLKFVEHLAAEGKFAHFLSNLPSFIPRLWPKDNARWNAYCESEYLRHLASLEALGSAAMTNIVLSVWAPTDTTYSWLERP